MVIYWNVSNTFALSMKQEYNIIQILLFWHFQTSSLLLDIMIQILYSPGHGGGEHLTDSVSSPWHSSSSCFGAGWSHDLVLVLFPSEPQLEEQLLQDSQDPHWPSTVMYFQKNAYALKTPQVAVFITVILASRFFGNSIR